MRIWSIHPMYLDQKGLVALWREALLAQAVLSGETNGYRNHPQLDRFKTHNFPIQLISSYLIEVHSEAKRRGYNFDIKKIKYTQGFFSLNVTSGQLEYEWLHLLKKLKIRDEDYYIKFQKINIPEPHPLFAVCPGFIEDWERV